MFKVEIEVAKSHSLIMLNVQFTRGQLEGWKCFPKALLYSNSNQSID